MVSYKIVSQRGLKDPTKGSEDFGIAYIDSSPALFVVADGYWGSGRAASSVAPHLFYRNLQDLTAHEHLSPENCDRLLQNCVTKTNDELRIAVPKRYTTFTAALVDDQYVYLLTLGDSVGFGHRTSGGLELLTEPDTDGYTQIKRFREDSDPFLSYCVIDNGRTGPKNFLGLPSTDFSAETHSAPQIKKVTVIPRNELAYLLLCTDGLTSRVTPLELETLCNTVDGEDILSAIMDRWEKPEEMIFYLLHELREKDIVANIFAQYGISMKGTSREIYDAIRAIPDGFAALRDACLMYDDGQGVRKPIDDTYVMLIDIRPIERKSVLLLTKELQEAHASLETAARDNGALAERISVLQTEYSTLDELHQALSAEQTRNGKKLTEELTLLSTTLAGVEEKYTVLKTTLEERNGVIQRYIADIQLREGREKDLTTKLRRQEVENAREEEKARQALLASQQEVGGYVSRIRELEMTVRGLETKLGEYQRSTDTGGSKNSSQKVGFLGKAARFGALTLGSISLAACASFFAIGYGLYEFISGEQTESSLPKEVSKEEQQKEEEKQGKNELEKKEFPLLETLQFFEKVHEEQPTAGLLSLCVTPDNRFAYLNPFDSRAYAFLPTENGPNYIQEVQCVLGLNVIQRKDTGVHLYYADALLTLNYNDPYRFVLNTNADAVSINDVLAADVSTISHCDYSKLKAVHGVKACTSETFTPFAGTLSDDQTYLFKGVWIGHNDEIIISTAITTEQVK
ncbi:protein phosphatase 2C domain-containing protein [Candidatus Woesearchaeota archaeon]|nr:protein phosphatase 2C domain-containing protein [Candidatus Woesearchaeota archaeon]